MAEDKRPPLPSFSSASTYSEAGDDPFNPQPPHIRFQEAEPSPYHSTASLPQEFGGIGDNYDEDELEKLPLTSNQPGGLYPPG